MTKLNIQVGNTYLMNNKRRAFVSEITNECIFGRFQNAKEEWRPQHWKLNGEAFRFPDQHSLVADLGSLKPFEFWVNVYPDTLGQYIFDHFTSKEDAVATEQNGCIARFCVTGDFEENKWA